MPPRKFPLEREPRLREVRRLGHILGAETLKVAEYITDLTSRETLDRYTVKVSTEYSGDALSCKALLCCRIRGFPVVKRVCLNGKDVDIHICRDKCSIYVCADIQLSGREKHEFRVELC
jgi:hypothetical protein